MWLSWGRQAQGEQDRQRELIRSKKVPTTLLPRSIGHSPGPKWFPFGVEPGASGNRAEGSHVSAHRKGPIEDYCTSLSRLQGQPPNNFWNVPAPLCGRFRRPPLARVQSRATEAPGRAAQQSSWRPQLVWAFRCAYRGPALLPGPSALARGSARARIRRCWRRCRRPAVRSVWKCPRPRGARQTGFRARRTRRVRSQAGAGCVRSGHSGKTSPEAGKLSGAPERGKSRPSLARRQSYSTEKIGSGAWTRTRITRSKVWCAANCTTPESLRANILLVFFGCSNQNFY